jgi:GDSL-like Lipase/Acylhydrolase
MIKRTLLLFGVLLWLPTLAPGDSADAPLVLRPQLANSGKILTNTAAKPSDTSQRAPFVLKNIIYLGDSYLDDGNYQAIAGYPVEHFSNEPPWPTDVNLALGFPAVGRWTPAGNPPNPLGNNYAVNGASIDGNVTPPLDTSFRGQVNLVLSDYPNGLPADKIVVVGIGTNDIIAAMELGGIWSLNLAGWRLKDSGFTLPAIGATVTVRVNDTLGLVPGALNLVVFPETPYLTVFLVTAVDAANSTVTLTNVNGTPGTLVSSNARFKTAAAYLFDLRVPVFAQEINALLNDGANLVLALPHRTDFMPFYDRQPNQSLAYVTWRYLSTKMASAISNKKPQIRFFELRGFFDLVFFNYTEFGFLYNYPGWNGNPNISANEYMFWDSFHPSGLMHQLIADDFIAFLQQMGLSVKP